MTQAWGAMRRRLKKVVAGVLFVGLLVGSGGTLFTVFAEAMSHLGRANVQTAVQVESADNADNPAVGASGAGAQQASGESSAPAEASNIYQPPVMEYSNTELSQGDSASVGLTSNGDNPNPDEDGVNSALAAAMDSGGVYLGEHLQNAFGSMLKGVLDTLFINTN
ncbi:hypothetical protein [Alicyclobacillus acidoterrestris]|uniref:Uncharacterized protein n=1 Tax=Alicyclobacillus acidoterrestris (strain ATCC 49025 / DSM 3922 / CIP 106132 / NCIMB 13137 / GD3B) TaxID=1356854 RepID=T0CY81_ALIAG|nr:hypothetical protein [Alicyclobacillus acidoterrestris]EPZ44312.1 hypothetical protein N007_11065 [Alicyclobacillus acidoterrestris ATCC 49025]UNO47915.1 hypothetical protein K1I37_14645 [Alicyclobacillus acidoterrestris]